MQDIAYCLAIYFGTQTLRDRLYWNEVRAKDIFDHVDLRPGYVIDVPTPKLSEADIQCAKMITKRQLSASSSKAGSTTSAT
jgi:hypothetical protein